MSDISLPSKYKSVTELEPGDVIAVAKTVESVTKSKKSTFRVEFSDGSVTEYPVTSEVPIGWA